MKGGSVITYGDRESRIGFRVLGPLEIFDHDGAPIVLTSAKQRLLLAVLLSQRNSRVATDALLDSLWEGRPPASARTNIQGYVQRLRRLLGQHRIVHRRFGYELIVDPAECDDVEFEALFDNGRHALQAGDALRATDLLGAALKLWRGAVAYADVNQTDAVHIESVRLGELRLACLELWVDARLELGQHHALVSELTVLVASHPLRQRFYLQLMLALQRAGRTAEALDVYQRARSAMVEELGLDPSPQLSELHQAILADEPTLLAPSTTAAPAPGSLSSMMAGAPAELPLPDPSFTGRHAEMQQITSWLRDTGSGIVAISGPGGIGKSALAVHVAHRVADEFSGGQIYINLHGMTPGLEPLGSGEVLIRLFRALGIDDRQVPEDLESAASILRSALAERRVLVVLDDVRDFAQIRPILPDSLSRSAFLITSRRVLDDIHAARHVPLGTLAPDEAIDLLAKLAGVDRTTDDPGVAAEIVGLCGHLPLAVRVAGARMLARPDWHLTSLRDRLGNAQSRLDELEHDDLAVRTSCDVAFRALQPSAAELFSLLGHIGFHDFTVHVAAAAAGSSIQQATTDLGDLVDAQLMATTSDDRYTMHDLVRLFAREQAARTVSPARGSGALRRVLHHCLASARNASRTSITWTERRSTIGPRTTELHDPGLDLPDGLAIAAWVRAEADNITAAASLAANLHEDGVPLLAGLAVAMAHPFRSQDRWSDIISLCQLALEAIGPAGNGSWRAMVHYALSDALFMIGRVTQARDHAQAALDAAIDAGDKHGESESLSILSYLAQHLDGLDEALVYHAQALAIQRELGDVRGRAHALTNIGVAYHAAGRLADAIGAHRQALELDQNPHLQGVALFRLGDVYLDDRQLGPALDCLEKAVLIFRSCGSRIDEALSEWLCGDILSSLGRTCEAHGRRRRSLDLLCEMRAMAPGEATTVLDDPAPAMPEPLRRGRRSREAVRRD